ncbi:hypothetical protein GUJ93_ZPchr0004g38746 [Zizania palustris]|uniref:Uncharacterized protein n=1 Tax=Zizania palustris TaxID=103762 RepID=A0A8J5SPE9_ZIZPA|nr:hypothetical protein GUJ93_ZPchr0004g38746 [Zizania palustris]
MVVLNPQEAVDLFEEFRPSSVKKWVVEMGSPDGAVGALACAVKLFRDLIFYRFVFPLLSDTMWYNYGELAPP